MVQRPERGGTQGSRLRAVRVQPGRLLEVRQCPGMVAASRRLRPAGQSGGCAARLRRYRRVEILRRPGVVTPARATIATKQQGLGTAGPAPQGLGAIGLGTVGPSDERPGAGAAEPRLGEFWFEAQGLAQVFGGPGSV